jgi:hypothetical protein
MIEEHVPDEGEFHEGPADPDAPPFPQGWTEVGFTQEPMTMNRGMMLGPARVYTQPVESPIFEAIDRASEDRTPVLETKVSFDYSALAEALFAGSQAAKGIAKSVENATWTMETIRKLYASVQPPRRQVALMGTGYRRHVHPGLWESNAEKRVEHTRRRRLYSERLRRDRRRVRKGRAPILRSSAFQMLIPRAQVDVRKVGPEYGGMEVVLSPMVPDDQVFVMDVDLMKSQSFVESKTFDFGETERRIERYRNQATMYGYGMSPTGRFRTTSYFRQMDAWNRKALGIEYVDRETRKIKGYMPSQVWVDDVEVDVDTWMNEGGA